MYFLACRHPVYQYVKYFSVEMCLCVHILLKSRLKILGVSVEVGRDLIEL